MCGVTSLRICAAEIRLESPYHLFEVSWEVCNKVGGIHTVVTSKALSARSALGERTIAIGPWLLSEDEEDSLLFEEEPGYVAFEDGCRELGVPVRVGRWSIPGRPLTILIEFSGLYERKDDILSDLWDRNQVDSLSGGWDYIEPVLFGHAAGIVIRRWWEQFIAPSHGRAVAHFHEWMTGSGLLYLHDHAPEVASVFTTHATMLGRSISSTGKPPAEGLEGRTPAEAAEDIGVAAKHSLEGICARQADCFTTVSAITAEEAEVFHERRADPLLPNGIDMAAMEQLCAGTDSQTAAKKLHKLANLMTGRDQSQAALVAVSGRYEFHNKGIDIMLDALAELNRQSGPPLVFFCLIPAGHEGLRDDLRERMEGASYDAQIPSVCTHRLPNTGEDPIAKRCAELGLDNSPSCRVSVISVPLYIKENDGLFNCTYESLLSGFDLSAFPSYYEPWGYTPQESLAVGVPTITSDMAGFGAWMNTAGLGADDGVLVLNRTQTDDETTKAAIVAHLDRVLGGEKPGAERCKTTAERTSWDVFYKNYGEAYANALTNASKRCQKDRISHFRPELSVPPREVPEETGPRLFEFDVSATLPQELSGLDRLARNLWWCWDPEASALFEELSPQSWKASGHNPIRFLRGVFDVDLHARVGDKAFKSRLERVLTRYDNYMAESARELRLADGRVLDSSHPVAYICAEYGLHESLPIYSGGLGILAGDHLKSASDINLPLIGVGLFYRKGYMRQQLGPHGEQIAVDVENDPRNLPAELVTDSEDRPIEVKLSLPSSKLILRAWRVAVGRVRLYLLDADHEGNRPEDREITHRLYGAEPELRLRQLISLGRGAVALFKKLGIDPAVLHINEGHGAFAPVERVTQLMRSEELSFEQAREFVRATTVFTTHTPVPAGHDRFSQELMRRYFSNAPDRLEITWDRFYGFGQAPRGGDDFNMTYLALGFSDSVNGVSALHGEVSKDLLHPYWPRQLTGDVPIVSVTNGIHLSTWTNPELSRLLGAPDDRISARDFASNGDRVDKGKLWEVRKRAKSRLIDAAAKSIEASFLLRQDSPGVLSRMLEGLDEDALLIGFARRFVPYKRAGLAFSDVDRLRRILSDEERPVRIFFAGKAHPADEAGRGIVREIAEMARSEELIGKIFFLENYDIDIARFLVQGVDVWLNNPIRKLEASGTSGMKVAANGGLNLSILDGWWVEGYDGKNGWAIGNQRVFPDQELQNEFDSENLYRLLEEELIPLYFDRSSKGFPSKWLDRVRHSLVSLPPMFNTDRMVAEYRDSAYLPLSANHLDMVEGRFARARELAAAHSRLRRHFGDVSIASARVTNAEDLTVGDALEASVEVKLGELNPEDVYVELVLGFAQGQANLNHPRTEELKAGPADENGLRTYTGSHRVERSGNYAYGLRIRPRVEGDKSLALSDLMLWA